MNIITIQQEEVKDLEALKSMAELLPRLTGGGEITIKNVVVIETENVPAYFLLQDMLKGKVVKEIPARVTKKYKARSPRPTEIQPEGPWAEPGVLQADPARKPMRAWRILDGTGACVEQITIDEKNRRLATGEFEPGTILHHPRAGRFLVTGRGPGQGMQQTEGGAG